MKLSISKGFWCAMLSWYLAAATNSIADSPVQAVSLANPSVPRKGGGNSDSLGSVISADGRFVLFLSTASNLSTNDDDGSRFVDVFLRDRTNQTTTLVSASLTGTGGGNGHSVAPVMSIDGRYVAFESEASNLVANDTNDVSDVFLRDLQSGTTTLLSVNSSGTGAGNGASTSPFISVDGLHVAFVSAASDLVANDSNEATDVFVRDLTTGTTTLVSVRADGTSGGNGNSDYPVMTPDGRWLAFASKSTNVVAGVTNNQSEIYVRDLVNGTTTWASANSAAIMLTVTNVANRPITSLNPVLSADGQFAAFRSYGAASLLLRHNLQTGKTDLVSSNAAGAPFAGDPSGPDMTADGRFIAFTEITGSNGSYSAVYLWDAQGGTKTLVSANLTGTISPDTSSDTPAVSADGRFVAFLSDAPDLATNAVEGTFQVFLRDIASGTTRLISVDRNGGVSGNANGAIPTISADGHFIAFDSFDGGYVTNDNNNVFDVFVRDMITETTELISQANATVQLATADGVSSVSANSVSADGRFVVFVSLADNLAVDDTNGYQDVFVRDLQIGTNILVSVNSAGEGSAAGFSTRPVMSANGRYVAFVSNAPDLTANKTNHIDDIFVRDLQAGTTTLISVSVDGATSGNAESSSPQISNDGRYVAFYSKAKNLVPNDRSGGGEIFWRDTQSGLTVSVTTNGNAPALLSLTADGRYVAAWSIFRELFVWDAQARPTVYTNLSAAASYGFVLSPDGRTLIFQSVTNTNYAIMAHDLVGGTDKVIGYSAIRSELKAQISGNGRFVTFVSTANAPNAPIGTNNVFLYDFQTATTTLVSFNRDRTGSGNGPSDSPSISADGRFVTYRSEARDLVAGDNNNQPDVFVFDRFTGLNSLISVRETGAGPGNASSSTPVISADGSAIVFKSVASDLIDNDNNGAQDVFVFHLALGLFVDLDGDGMDDGWETRYFGDLTHTGSADSDGDGVSDWMESKAGTDPMNPVSRFSPQAALTPGTGQISITWQSAPGRSYRVQYKDDLSQANWNDLDDGVLVNGTSAECRDTAAGAGKQRFYRISLVE